MINFRYHVVSLISVFLALAVGIILGAGPLKQSIGDQLTGQVAALRSEKEQLRTQLGTAQDSVDQSSTAITAYAPGILADTLTGSQVTVIEVAPGADAPFKDLSSQLTAAGAHVQGRIAINDVWLADSGSATRALAASTLVSSGLPIDTSQSASQQVAQGLALALTKDDGSKAHKLSKVAKDALNTLQVDGLISVERTPTVATTDVVVLAGVTTAPTSDATPAPGTDALDFARDREEEILTAAHTVLPGTVAAGPADSPDGLVADVRSNGDLQVEVSTVSGVDTLIGQVNTPLALADQAAGTVGHYGFDSGTTQAIPDLPPRITVPQSSGSHGKGS